MINIIEFKEEYNEKVNQFLVEIYVNEYGFIQREDELRSINNIDYIKNGGSFYIALDEQDNVIGTICLDRINNIDAYLKRMYVDKNYRGKGLASQLMEKIEEKAKELNIKKMYLSTYKQMERANSFYLKNGYVKVIKQDEPNKDVVFYEKEL